MARTDEDHERLTTKEALRYAGFDSLEEITRRWHEGRLTGVPAMCTCHHYVEVDGECPHGHPSILRGNALV